VCNSCQSFKFSGHYLRNRSTLDIGVLGYIGVVQHKEHSPEDLSILPWTPCIWDKNTVNRKFHSNGQNFTSNRLLDSSWSKSMDENAGCYNDPQLIHSFNEGLYHCVSMLR